MNKSEEEILRKAEEELVNDVLSDFKRRQEERKSLERTWQLNMNFLCGNQYCDINSSGELEQENSVYYWQPKRVFNYIAPTIEARLAKLSAVHSGVTVRAATSDENDVHSAKVATSILNSTLEEQNIKSILSRALAWSETCGTAFYKIVWNSEKGAVVCLNESGKVHEGDVEIVPVSPFEIYPYSLSEESLENQVSIIHAKAMPVSDIAVKYGVEIAGREIDDFNYSPYSENMHSAQKLFKNIKAVKHDHEVVIERYTKPNSTYPQGRLTIVAGDRLLYDGELPYINGVGKTRTYPFVKQSCFGLVGGFFGGSVVDRLIPVQRAYNAVKNRKHEFLNRISMGVVAVEDGAVDIDELLDDGLMPGKVLVYRQGSKAPEMLELGSVPNEFSQEEDSLREEFDRISGVGEITQKSGISSVTSATGISLIIEQNDARLNTSFDYVKNAIKSIGCHILRLYRQFATTQRIKKCVGNTSELDVFYFTGSDISSDDVILEADQNHTMTAAQQRAIIFELISKGLFFDENGSIPRATRNKILTLLGYGGFVEIPDVEGLHKTRAEEENVALLTGDVAVKNYDNHAVHIREHTVFLLSGRYDDSVESRISAHLMTHKAILESERRNEKFSEETNSIEKGE